MKTKILAIVLACLMIVSILPMAIFADEATNCPGKGNTHTKDSCECTVVKVQDAYCSEVGYTLYHCDECGDYFTDDLKVFTGSTEHNFVTTDAVAATCTEAGKKAEKTCTICGKVEGGEEIEALGHSFTILVDTTAANCETGGTQIWKCDRCDATEEKELPAGGHTWDDKPDSIALEPTSEATGIAVYKCKVCGATKNVTIEKAKHVIITVAAKAATCTEAGNKVYYQCKDCKKYFTAADGKTEVTAAKFATDYVIKALGHTTVDDASSTNVTVVTRLSCTSNALCAWDCGRYRCGEHCTDLREATGHDIKTVTVAAKCDAYAYTFTYCANAHCTTYETKTVFTDLDAAEYDVRITVNKAKVGVHLVSCTVNKDAGFNPNAHTLETITINAPTCVTKGNKIVYCSKCSYVGNVEEIAATGHKWPTAPKASTNDKKTDDKAGQYVTTTEQSCTEDRTWTLYCQNDGCSETKTQVDTGRKKLGHTYGDVDTVAPTCNSDGYSTKTCTRDAGICNANNIPETIYDKTAKKDVRNPDYTRVVYVTENVKFAEPTVGFYATYAKAKAAHTGLAAEGSGNIYQTGNCEKIGLYVYNCADCNINVFVKIDKTGEHTLPKEFDKANGEFSAKPVSCLEDGYTAAYTCTVCHKFIPSVPIVSNGQHTWKTNIAAKAPTCTVAGNVEETKCTVCGAFKTVENEDGTVSVLNGHNIEKLNHGNVDLVKDFATADCTNYGYKHQYCTLCGTDKIVDYVFATGHTVVEVEAVDPVSCKVPGHTAYTYCSVCGSADEPLEGYEEVKLAHKNAADEEFVSCTDKVTDLKCVLCDTDYTDSETLHSIVKYESIQSCVNAGYTVYACSECDYTRVDRTTIKAPLGHDILWTVVDSADFNKEGLKHGECSRCDYVVDEVIPANAGFVYDVTAVNANNEDATIVDSSLIAVKITLKTVEADVWSVMAKLTYDPAVVTFEGCEFTTDVFTAGNMYHNNIVSHKETVDGEEVDVIDGAYVTVLAKVPNTANGKVQNATIEEANDFVTLYFRVTNSTATTTKFEIANTDVQALNKDGEALAAMGSEAEVAIAKLLDVNCDGTVGLEDALAIELLLNGELFAEAEEGEEPALITYIAAADVDCDGEITATDLYNLYMYLIGAVTYEELTAAVSAQ